MGHSNKGITAFLEANGIKDPVEFLSSLDGKVSVRPASHPLIELRGSVHLMLKRCVSREEINRRFAALRHV